MVYTYSKKNGMAGDLLELQNIDNIYRIIQNQNGRNSNTINYIVHMVTPVKSEILKQYPSLMI